MHSLRSWSLAGVALCALMWMTAPILSQEGGGRGGRGGFGGGFGGGAFRSIDRPTLLASDQVRKELKVTEDQGKKLEEILAAHRQQSMELFGGRGARNASPEEREKRRKESAEKSAQLLKTTEEKLQPVLAKEQSQRLDEILLQQQGADALVAESVVAALKLSKEQTDKIRSVLAARDQETSGLRGGPGGGGAGFEEMREKMEKSRKKAEEDGLAVLSKEQKETLEKLKGKPFNLDRRSLFGNRGGPQGGPGAPGGPGAGPGGGRSGGGSGSGERKRPPDDDSK